MACVYALTTVVCVCVCCWSDTEKGVPCNRSRTTALSTPISHPPGTASTLCCPQRGLALMCPCTSRAASLSRTLISMASRSSITRAVATRLLPSASTMLLASCGVARTCLRSLWTRPSRRGGVRWGLALTEDAATVCAAAPCTHPTSHPSALLGYEGGGLFRDLRLIRTSAPARLADDGVFVPTVVASGNISANGPTPADGLTATASIVPQVTVEVASPVGSATVTFTARITLYAEDGVTRVGGSDVEGSADGGSSVTLAPPAFEVRAAQLWSIARPYLYVVVAELLSAEGAVIDSVNVTLGVRSIAFDANEGAFLNEKVCGCLRGWVQLHCCYPYGRSHVPAPPSPPPLAFVACQAPGLLQPRIVCRGGYGRATAHQLDADAANAWYGLQQLAHEVSGWNGLRVLQKA